MNDTLELYHHAEGRVVLSGVKPAFQYRIADHLGNTVVFFEDRDGDAKIKTELMTSDPDSLEVLQRNYYYPFGMEMEGPWQAATAPRADYLYNGKELEEDLKLNWYAYGFRYYDPSIGRFTGVDPLATQMPAWSPYCYTFNNPVRLTDLYGLAPDDWVETSSGKFINDPKVKDAASAQERYGAEAKYLGESLTFTNENGEQVSLNSNGLITRASFLNPVEVSASRLENDLDLADNLASGLDLGVGANSAIITGAITLSGGEITQYIEGMKTISSATAAIGKMTGIIGIVDSGIDFYNHASLGNSLKLAYDITVTAAKLNPFTALAVGLLEVSGVKDMVANAIDRAAEDIQYRKWLDSQTIKIGY